MLQTPTIDDLQVLFKSSHIQIQKTEAMRCKCNSSWSRVDEMQLKATLPGPTAQRVLSPCCFYNKDPHHHFAHVFFLCLSADFIIRIIIMIILPLLAPQALQ